MQGGPGAGGKRKRETNEEIERVPWPCTVQFIARYLSYLVCYNSLYSIIWCFFGRVRAGVAALCVSPCAGVYISTDPAPRVFV